MPSCYLSVRFSALFALSLVLLFSLSPLQAKEVDIADRGFTLTLPDNYVVTPPDYSGVLLQADSPSGESSIQVVEGVSDVPLNALSGDYEVKMNTIFPGLTSLSEHVVDIGETPHLFKHYATESEMGRIDVLALFYMDEEQSMIVHAVDISGEIELMAKIITSLTPPQRTASLSRVSAQKAKDQKLSEMKSDSDSTLSRLAQDAAYHWFSEKASGLQMKIPINWKIAVVDSRIVFSPSEGEPLYEKGGLQIQNLSRSAERYRNLELASTNMLDFIDAHESELIQKAGQELNGLNVRFLEFRIALSSVEYRHIWVLFVERSKIITMIQYEAVGNLKTISESTNAMLDHVIVGLETIREL
jgi:hypothetical protein